MVSDLSTPEAALLALSVGAALIHGVVFLRRPNGLARTIAKTAPLAALALLAAAMQAPPLLIAALALSALGDAALAHEGERPFMVGLGAFLAAHALYIPLFWDAGGRPLGWRWLVAAALALAAIGVFAAIRRGLGPLTVPVMVYMAAILAMGFAALAAPGALWPITVGALLFIASDCVLAFETFAFADNPRRWTAPAVWWPYYGGQLLIAAAFLHPAFAG